VLATTSVGTVSRVNLTSMQYIVISESHTASVLKVAFDEGEHARFATASADGTLKVWDLVEYSVISTSHARREQERGAIPLCLAFANMLISGWSDGRYVIAVFSCQQLHETGVNYEQ
jgi:WD40 repeat protein